MLKLRRESAVHAIFQPLDESLAGIDEMVQDGLVTLERVQVINYRADGDSTSLRRLFDPRNENDNC